MYKNINEVFEAFSQFKIAIIGDVMIDSYLWGKVDRISPEAPVPVISKTKRENRLGGAANVALNIQSLGAVPLLFSVVGNDDNAEILISLMKNANMPVHGIIKDESRPTTIKTRIISGSQQLLRIDQESTDELTSNIEKAFIQEISNTIKKEKPNAIIFQDYDKGSLTPNVIFQIINLANSQNIPTLIDPKKKHFFDFKNGNLFKPNFKELTEGLNINLEKGDTNGLIDAAKTLANRLQTSKIMVTLSELGVFILDGDKHYLIPAEIRDIADVSGAGDTVISMASLCTAAGLDAFEIARLSNFAGGLVCEKAGVVPIKKSWIIDDGYKLKEN